jgi:dihydroorotate dehydrogenase (fumarate)
MSFKTTIGSVNFVHPIYNASGPLCTTRDHLVALGMSSSSAIITKTCTIEQRDGNPHPKYFETSRGSINSNGFENLGYKAYIQLAGEMKKKFPHKPFIVSTSGMKYDENITLVNELSTVDAIDMIELNMSCPNLVGKPQIGYDFEMSEKLLSDVFDVCKKPLGVKLPPYFDFVHYEKMAKVLKGFNLSFISCVNSLGNGMVIDAETEQVVIHPRGGFGGVGGDYIKPVALANVRKFYELLGNQIPIVGVGGVRSGVDVFEYILAGATAVQVGTTLMKQGPGCFARLEGEFNEIMRRKGYNSIEDVRGKLKPLGKA